MTMTLIEFAGFAKRCYGEFEFLAKAFSDDTLVSVLQEVGHVEFTAAASALRSSRTSNAPSHLIREAVSHLRSAYYSYTRAANKRRLFGLMKATPTARCDAYEAALGALLLMAVCYKFVGDHRNASDTLDLAAGLVPNLQQAVKDGIRRQLSWNQVPLYMDTEKAGWIEEFSDNEERARKAEEEARQLIGDLRDTICEMKRLLAERP